MALIAATGEKPTVGKGKGAGDILHASPGEIGDARNLLAQIEASLPTEVTAEAAAKFADAQRAFEAAASNPFETFVKTVLLDLVELGYATALTQLIQDEITALPKTENGIDWLNGFIMVLNKHELTTDKTVIPKIRLMVLENLCGEDELTQLELVRQLLKAVGVAEDDVTRKAAFARYNQKHTAVFNSVWQAKFSFKA